MQPPFSQSRLIWRPQETTHTTIEAFRRMINLKRGLGLKDIHDLHRYSVEDYAFWLDLWALLGIIYSVPPQKVIAEGRIKEIPTWFPSAKLNFAENLLFRRHHATAYTLIRESGSISHYTFREVYVMVEEMAAALRVNGLQIGDRVAAIVTNSIHAIVIALAVASIGAIFSSTAPDLGAQVILDRYKQIEPKFVFTETEIMYAGKTINLLPKIAHVTQELRTHGLQKVVLLPSTRTGKDVAMSVDSITLSAFLATGDKRPLIFEQLPFSQPLFILFSSGTSGPPKCIVHSAGGVLMQNKKEYMLTYDMGINDTYFHYTSTGWVLWNAMIHALSCGARTILYDGSPFYPSVTSFLKMVDKQGVTIFGASPRFLAEVKGQGIVPHQIASFETVRVLISAGAVLTAPMFEWTQEAFGEKVHIISGMGATDTCSILVSGASTLPVYAGELQAKSLGMKIEIYDPEGNSIEDSGIPGELVCTRPHPSLPLCFWGDSADEKFRAAYFDMYPGIWRQGDFVVKNPQTGGFIFLGRSDGVLNPNGVRIGTSEIYSVMEKFGDVIDDSLCVGQRRPQDTDERILLFVKLRPGHDLTPVLERGIKDVIRRSLSARHVPSFIFAVEDIPYTVTNKKVEIAVKQIVSGSKFKPSGTVINPTSLDLYYKYRDLEKLVKVQDGSKLKRKPKL